MYVFKLTFLMNLFLMNCICFNELIFNEFTWIIKDVLNFFFTFSPIKPNPKLTD